MRRFVAVLAVVLLVAANASAAKLELTKGSTSVELEVFIQDSSSTTGAGLTGLVYNSAGLGCQYYLTSVLDGNHAGHGDARDLHEWRLHRGRRHEHAGRVLAAPTERSADGRKECCHFLRRRNEHGTVGA